MSTLCVLNTISLVPIAKYSRCLLLAIKSEKCYNAYGNQYDVDLYLVALDA